MDAVFENATSIMETEDLKFTWHDYVLFCIMLFSSALIGLYFGCTGKKQSSADEYLLGGKEMGVFPIAMSLISSYVSGITILAVPSDVYQYGSTYWLCAPAIVVGVIISYYAITPVFINLQLTSTFEYLKLRFNEKVRGICSFLFTLAMILYLPIVIYVPALALAQGTGFNIHYITPLLCGICIFYTTIGGLKAVVWTDTLQFALMIGATMIITYKGTVSAGGFWEIYRLSKEGDRIDLDYDLDFTKRDTFWTGSLGLFFTWINAIGISQGCVQKCKALPSRNHIKKAFLIYALGMTAFISCSVYTGLMIYAKYNKCDPIAADKVKAHDQLLPYFVLDVAGKIPGLPGIFIAGIFSAALSTLSAGMNCLSCTIYEDFLSDFMPKNITQKRISNILKLIVIIVGIVCTALVFVVEKMGGILELGLSLAGITAGPTLGIFMLGMLAPSANSKGALYGGIGSIIIMSWMVVGSQYSKMSGYIVYESKPTTVDGCYPPVNQTENQTSASSTNWEPMYIYKVSHYYYSLIGCLLVFIIGLPVSWLTKNNEPPVQKELISPVMQWALPDNKNKNQPPKDYFDLNQALKIIKINTSE